MVQQHPLETQHHIHIRLRQLAEQDRDVMEKGVKAFVSYVRAYKEHHCKYIFRIADLDLPQLGTAIGLLRLPKMPELRKAAGALKSFQASDVDPDQVKVPFLSTARLLILLIT